MTPSSTAPTNVTDVTVVIPVRNRAEELPAALASVAGQTMPPTRVIVVDDASEDGSAEVAERHGVEVIRHQAPRGAGRARNAGIRASSTRWIAFLDSDDTWHPDHLETVVAAAEEGHALVSASAIDTFGKVRGNAGDEAIEVTPARCFVPDNPIVTSTVLADRQALVDAGLFRPLVRAEDLDLWPRLLERGSGLVVPRTTAYYHARETWLTREVADSESQAVFDVVSAFEDREWMSAEVHAAIRVRMEWDRFRHAQHERRWNDAARHALRLAQRPRNLTALLTMLRDRYEARRRGRLESI